jgi:hypothetical protein
MQENFSVIISVLDGKGFLSDSGMRGRRGYDGPIVFNWLGATTPLPAATHRMMAQLGTRWLFYEVPSNEPTEDECVEYAERDEASEAETRCNDIINFLLMTFFEWHPIGTVDAGTIQIPHDAAIRLVRWARLIVRARTEIKCEKEDREWKPIAAGKPEGPWKVIGYLKELARGHALIHQRGVVNAEDLELIETIALSSIPGHIRPIVRELQQSAVVDSTRCRVICGVSAPTARKYLEELRLLGIVDVTKGNPETNQPDTAVLRQEFGWLLD